MKKIDGNKIRVLRERSGATQTEIADAVGVTQTTISKLELNIKPVGVEILIKLSEKFGCRIDDLLIDERKAV